MCRFRSSQAQPEKLGTVGTLQKQRVGGANFSFAPLEHHPIKRNRLTG